MHDDHQALVARVGALAAQVDEAPAHLAAVEAAQHRAAADALLVADHLAALEARHVQRDARKALGVVAQHFLVADHMALRIAQRLGADGLVIHHGTAAGGEGQRNEHGCQGPHGPGLYACAAPDAKTNHHRVTFPDQEKEARP